MVMFKFFDSHHHISHMIWVQAEIPWRCFSRTHGFRWKASHSTITWCYILHGMRSRWWWSISMASISSRQGSTEKTVGLIRFKSAPSTTEPYKSWNISFLWWFSYFSNQSCISCSLLSKQFQCSCWFRWQSKWPNSCWRSLLATSRLRLAKYSQWFCCCHNCKWLQLQRLSSTNPIGCTIQQ